MLRRIVMTLIAAVAIAGFIIVGTSPKQDQLGKLPGAVEAVSPPGGDLDLRQATIAADLAPGYSGILSLDGVELPLDQQVMVEALNSVTFRPGTEGDFGQLQPGRHCATVRYRRFDRPDVEAGAYNWCFNLH